MDAIRALLRRHRRLSAIVLALALAMKLLVPAGYMLGAKAHVLTVEVCADSTGERLFQRIAVPQEAPVDHAKVDATCAWSAAGMPALGGANAPLLALALAFILLLGFAPVQPRREADPARLLPPLRGPPAYA